MNAPAARSAPASNAADDAVATLDRLLRERHSCRAYRADPVPRTTIESILALAQRTASWCNSQPWHLTIASGAALESFRSAIVAHVKSGAAAAPDFAFPREYRGIYLERRRECGFQLYEAVGVARGDKAGYARQAMENFQLFGAPHVAIVTSDEALGVYGAVDCGAYVGTFMLAAQAHGVACIAQAAIAGYSDFVHRHFSIADDRRVVCAISFGFADAGHRANGFRTSRDLANAVTWVDGPSGQ